VTLSAVDILRLHKPDVMFVHLPGVDNAGHAKGWGTDAQLAAVNVADGCVGQLLDTLEKEGLADSTLIIVTADHGGAGRTHGAEDPRSRHIPWIVSGPGVRKDLDLTFDRDLTIDVYDTFSTVCAMLAIPVPHKVTGKFVADILEGRELVQPASPPPYRPAEGKERVTQ
jgi:arylsulfatase A-like enzyme